jgi:hypothetical protein
MLVEQVLQRFAKRQGVTVEMDGASILKIQKGEWVLSVSWEEGAPVLMESKAMASHFLSDTTQQAEAGSSVSRISIYADPDPQMAHFNDYVVALAGFDHFPGLYVLEGGSGKMQRTGRLIGAVWW